MLQLSQIADLLQIIVTPRSKIHELEIVSKNVSKNMTPSKKRMRRIAPHSF